MGLVFTPEAEQHLVGIQDFISDRSSAARATGYVERIIAYCQKLAEFPFLGIARDDLRPGLRVIGFEGRVTIAFNRTEKRIEILGIYYGGRDWETLV